MIDDDRAPVSIEGKLRSLQVRLSSLPGALTAYSGGVDSSLLAEAAHRALGSRASAVTADSPSIPRREIAAAVELARDRGWHHLVIETRELSDPRYAANPVDRCYFCKSELFERLEPLAAGRPILLGTVTDDFGDWRPGARAAAERGALHPLADAGLSKAEVRSAARAFGLPTADKAASACLASRLAYGVPVTAAGLRRVEQAEDLLLDRGFEVVRVRDLGGDHARVEVSPAEVDALTAVKELVVSELQTLGFGTVEIDERGYRRGALNEMVHLGAPRNGGS